MLGAVIVGVMTGFAAAGMAWTHGAGLALSLLCYSLGGAAGLALAAAFSVPGSALVRMLERSGADEAAKATRAGTQSAEMH